MGSSRRPRSPVPYSRNPGTRDTVYDDRTDEQLVTDTVLGLVARATLSDTPPAERELLLEVARLISPGSEQPR